MPDPIGWKSPKQEVFAVVLVILVSALTTFVTMWVTNWAGFERRYSGPDMLTFTNGGVYGVGVMVDGSIASTSINPPENDRPAVGSSLSPMMLWGDFIPSTAPLKAGNEIIAFSQGLGPTLLENVPWSPGEQNIPITFDPAYHLRVAVRIVGSPSTFLAKNNRAMSACYEANRLWGEEGRGIIVSCSQPEDKTVLGSSPVSFTCLNEGDLTGMFIQNVGFTQGQINVYYVDTVESEELSGGSGTAYGVHCPENPDVIAMGVRRKIIFSHTRSDTLSRFTTSIAFCSISLPLRPVPHQAPITSAQLRSCIRPVTSDFTLLKEKRFGLFSISTQGSTT